MNLMRMDPDLHQYDLSYKKQILAFQIIAIAESRLKKPKKALKTIFQA